MDFGFSKAEEELRREVRTFLEEEIRQGSFQVMEDAWMVANSQDFSRKLSKKGWIGMTYPREYGGGGRSYMDRLIVTEELLRYGAPVRAHWTPDRQVGPAIISFGTEEQKKEFLPKIIAGEMQISLGFSEPEAGSDLASLRATAIEQEDCFLANGQKIWTSGAHLADYIYMIARTDPSAPKKQHGLSVFLVSTKLPGVTIRPIVDIAGHSHFCEIFLEDVKIPKEALLGKKNRGWNQIGENLVFERAGMERLMTNYPLYERLKKYVRETEQGGQRLSEVPWIRAKMAEMEMRFETGRLLVYRCAWLLDQIGKTKYVPNWETAMTKAFCVDFEQDLANTATKIAGLYGNLVEGSKWVPLDGMIGRSYLFSPGYSLQGGSQEILRGIIAMRGLGLPRE
jgi:alkylation response protein AidB-like acyl-CoA dehydrogenase